MDPLRISLLIIGVVFLIALYFFGRIKTRDGQQFSRRSLRAILSPILERLSAISWRKQSVRDEDDIFLPQDLEQIKGLVADKPSVEIDAVEIDPIHVVASDEQLTPDTKELMIVLTIMAPEKRPFKGPNILQSIQAAGMRYGDMNIYHRYVPQDSDDSRPVCSLANGVEPGSLEPQGMEDLTTPALSLFMNLPGPVEGRDAFQITLDTGQQLAEQLGGELCDGMHNILTEQAINHLKEKIEAYRFKRQMARLKRRHKILE